MTSLAPLVLALLPSAAPDSTVGVEAHIVGDERAVGGTYELVVSLTFEGGASLKKAGMPAPMLQIDPPACIELTGERLTTYEQLAANEFLQMPFERMIEGDRIRVGFELTREPEEGDTIGLIVTGYVDGGEEGPWFLRRRLELPLTPKSSAVRGNDADSSWGADEGLVGIGEKAPLFTLPRPDGGLVALEQFLGDKNVIVTTYRAHW